MVVRQPPGYIVGESGPAVVVGGRVAAALERYAGLDAFRRQMRGTDPELDNTLLALRMVALAWRTSVTGRREEAPPEAEAASLWVNTNQAALRLGIGDRAVRLAIQEKRLPAVMVDGRWRITRIDLELYRAARAA